MTRDCWKDFAATGRVSDYLKYREQEHRCEQPVTTAVWLDGAVHGTDDSLDRHGALSNACR